MKLQHPIYPYLSVFLREIMIKKVIWWSQGGSNPWPLRCQRSALPAELWPQKNWCDALYEVDTPFTIDNYKLVYESEDILELTLLADGSKGKLTFLIYKKWEKGVLFFFDYVDYDDFPQKATYRCIEN